uniref:C-type lectin domain-containing protein n=1 Tax=Plectus sambesii TaxID=2011161 RepID=A0A914VU40_9BILA
MPPSFFNTTTSNTPSALALVTALVTVLTEERVSQGCCSNGWSELISGQCYYANSTNVASWRQANDSCRAINAVLAYPANNDDQLALQAYISSRWGYQTVHIGIYYDRFQQQWKNADNIRSDEKPNSDKTSAGDWCSSLVPYPWHEKSAFIMQIVDCNNVRAPFICQIKGCRKAQCDSPPCYDIQQPPTTRSVVTQ